MCNFFSAVITKKNKKCLFCWESDSHEDIKKEYHLKDEKLPPDFVPVELTPPDGNLAEMDLSKWNFKTDLDEIPEWYDEKKARRMTESALKEFIKEKFLINQDIKEIKDKTYKVAINTKISVLRGNSSVGVLWGNSSVGVLHGNSRVGELWGNSSVGVLWGNSSVGVLHGNSRVGVLRENSSVGVLWGNSSVGVLRENSSVGVLRENSSVGVLWGNSSVGELWGNSSVGVLYGNSRVGVLWGNSSVGVLHGSSCCRKLEDGKWVIYTPAKTVKASSCKA